MRRLWKPPGYSVIRHGFYELTMDCFNAEFCLISSANLRVPCVLRVEAEPFEFIPIFQVEFASISPGEIFPHRPGCVKPTPDGVKLTRSGNHHQSFTAKILMARLMLMVGVA
jgi:hypothetical protein